MRKTISILLVLALFASQLEAGRHRPSQQDIGRGYSKYVAVAGVVFAACALYAIKLFSSAPSSVSQKEDSRKLDNFYKKWRTKGGMTMEATAIMRFPHMLSDLMDRHERLQPGERPSVLILGTGIQNDPAGPGTPFVHEIAAVFQNSDIEIVDFDPRVRKAVAISKYREDFYQKWANKLVANEDNFSRFKNTKKDDESKHTRQQIKKLLANMPLNLSDLIKAGLSIDVKTTYFETHNPGKYDYIIATKSFIYPLSREDLSHDQQIKLVSKYLHALSDRGRMYVDYQTAWIFKEDGLVDESEFDFHVIEHKTSYLSPMECVDKLQIPEADYIGCNVGDGKRINATEDIVVIERKQPGQIG